MKISKKSMIILFSILAVIGIAVGGCSMHQYQKKQEMIAIATSDEAKKVYEEYLNKEDPYAFTEKGFVHSYQVKQDSLSYNPMGGLMVSLIINDDEEMLVDYNLIEGSDGDYTSAFYGSTPKFWQTRDKYYKKEEK